MNDKLKITVLCAIIAFLIVAVGAIGFLGYKSYIRDLVPDENTNVVTTTKKNGENSSETTTTGTNTTSKTNGTTTKVVSDPTTKKPTNTTRKTTTTSRRKTTTTKKTTMTTRVTTTAGASNYPNALDDWEWKIVNLINAEREKNGLSKLTVNSSLRTKAEQAADAWENLSEDELKAHLDGYAFYGKWSNDLNSSTGYNYLYESTKKNSIITTKNYITDIGVGVILKKLGVSNLPTYYYIVIYE